MADAADKIALLVARCKAGVHLTINEHRNYYESAEHRIDEWYAGMEIPPEIDAETRQLMIDTDTIVDLQFYPDTPVGSYHIVHYDLDHALAEALVLAKAD